MLFRFDFSIFRLHIHLFLWLAVAEDRCYYPLSSSQCLHCSTSTGAAAIIRCHQANVFIVLSQQGLLLQPENRIKYYNRYWSFWAAYIMAEQIQYSEQTLTWEEVFRIHVDYMTDLFAEKDKIYNLHSTVYLK